MDEFKRPDNTSEELEKKTSESDEARKEEVVQNDEVADAAKEGASFKDKTDAKLEEAGNASAQNAGMEGDLGVKTKPIGDSKGKTKVMNAANGHVYQSLDTNIGMEEYMIESDIDRYEANAIKQASQYVNIASDIDVEQTKAFNDIDDKSLVDPVNEASIERLPNDTVDKVFTNAVANEPVDSKTSRTIGTLFERDHVVLNPTGDIIDQLHDIEKGFNTKDGLNPNSPYQSAVLFNKLDINGNIIPNEYVRPKEGKFILLGINKFACVDNHGHDVSNLSCEKDSNNDDVKHNRLNYNTLKGITDCKYYDSPESNPNRLFKVMDVTATRENIANVTADAAKILQCNKSKMQLGMYEALSAQLAKINDTLGEGDETVNKYPEMHKDRDRCTLWRGEANGIYAGNSKVTTACNNHPTRLMKFIQGLKASEMIYTLAGVGIMNGTKSILWGKGQTGKQANDVWFRAYSGWSNRQDAIGHYTDADSSIKLPNMVPFMRGIGMSNSQIKRAGSLAMAARELKDLISNFTQFLTQNESIKNLLSRVETICEVTDQLNDALAMGRLKSDEGMSSNAIIKLPDQIDIILDFDPNDLVQCVGHGSRTKWYPSCGYANIMKDGLSIRNSVINSYYMLPTWIDIIIKYCNDLRSDDMYKLDLTNTDRGLHEAMNNALNKPSAHKTLCNWLLEGVTFTNNNSKDEDHFIYGSNKRYLPIIFDSFTGSLFAYMFAHACSIASADVFNKNNKTNAYLNRWLTLIDNWGLKDILNEFYDGDLYSLTKAVLDNSAFQIDPKVQKPSKYPLLYERARERFLSKCNNIIGISEYQYMDKSDNNGVKEKTVVYQPDKKMQNLFTLRDITIKTQDNKKDESSYGRKYTVNVETFVVKDENNQDITVDKDSLISPEQLHKALASVTPIKTNNSDLTDRIIRDETIDNPFIIYKNRIALYGNEGRDIKHTVRDLTYRQAVTNFEVDDAYYHYEEDPAKQLFGDDCFFITTHDIMTFGELPGVFGDGNIDNSIIRYTYSNVMLLPQDIYYDRISVGGRQQWPIKHIYGFTAQTESRQWYDAGNLVPAVDVEITNPLPTREYPNYYKHVAYRRLCRPSLYGYMRDVTYGCLDMTADMTSRHLEEDFTSAKSYKIMQYPTIKFGFLPKILGREYNKVSHEWDTYKIDPEVTSYNVTNADYYIKQSLFVGDAYAQYTGDDAGYSIDQFFELGNWLIQHGVLYSEDAHAEVSGCTAHSKATLVAIDDEQKRLLDYYHKGRIANCYIQLNKNWVPGVHMDPDWIFNDAYCSKMVFNDYHSFIIGRPIGALNEKWRSRNNYTPLFYKQYKQ